MRFVDMIERKAEGLALSSEEIRFMVDGYVSGAIPDYQMSAMTMAIMLKGMSDVETAQLTMAMMESGDTVDLSDLPGIKVDKHSTGGVGDTTTLVVAPLVAACGGTVAKMSGRGLGHTGGTLDKIESVPGASVEIPLEEFKDIVRRNGVAVIGQTAKLVPADKKIYALRQGRNVGGLLPISGIVQNVFDNLNEAAASGNRIPGIPTGLPDLDRMILGLNKSELILVAGRPGMGKTSIALNIALHAAMHEGKTIAIFSLEMSREQLASRLLSKAALVPSQNLMTGQLTPQQWRDITDAAQQLSMTDIRIDDNPTLTVSEMNAQCRRIPKLDLVIIDYLQLMQSAGSGHSWSNESRTQAVSDISRMMKIMAKELNVPVICASQLSRANESRQDKRPVLSDLRESGAIEQDADVVIGLYRDGYYNKESENPNLAEAIILKNRKGQTGTVELLWLPEYTSFSLLEKRRDDDD